MIDLINELPEDGLKSSPETSRFTENKWISRKKNQSKLYFLPLIDILNDLLLISEIVKTDCSICKTASSLVQTVLISYQF